MVLRTAASRQGRRLRQAACARLGSGFCLPPASAPCAPGPTDPGSIRSRIVRLWLGVNDRTPAEALIICAAIESPWRACRPPWRNGGPAWDRRRGPRFRPRARRPPSRAHSPNKHRLRTARPRLKSLTTRLISASGSRLRSETDLRAVLSNAAHGPRPAIRRHRCLTKATGQIVWHTPSPSTCAVRAAQGPC